jgi:hypothetical protein
MYVIKQPKSIKVVGHRKVGGCYFALTDNDCKTGKSTKDVKVRRVSPTMWKVNIDIIQYNNKNNNIIFNVCVQSFRY